MPQRHLKLTIAYDGTDYAGWQIQTNVRTVQQILQEALFTITSEHIRVVASGRTDAGVHALGQVVSLTTHSSLAAPVLLRALNANTPQDLVVLDVEEASPGFHAIRHATGKHYRYQIQDGPIPDLFSRKYVWHVPRRLDENAIHEAAQSLLGKHDFSSFEAAGSPRASSVRTIRGLRVARQSVRGFEQLMLEISADGFLYNMARNIVGTLVEVGHGREEVDWVAQVLAQCDREAAGPTAPAHGLFLVRVDYDSDP